MVVLGKNKKRKRERERVGQPKHTRTSLTADVWAGAQSRRQTTVHGCNKGARLFRETRADKQSLSSTVRGRKSAALPLTGSAVLPLFPIFLPMHFTFCNVPCHHQKASHAFFTSSQHEEHLGARRRKVIPEGSPSFLPAFLPRCSKPPFFFPFPKH